MLMLTGPPFSCSPLSEKHRQMYKKPKECFPNIAQLPETLQRPCFRSVAGSVNEVRISFKQSPHIVPAIMLVVFPKCGFRFLFDCCCGFALGETKSHAFLAVGVCAYAFLPFPFPFLSVVFLRSWYFFFVFFLCISCCARVVLRVFVRFCAKSSLKKVCKKFGSLEKSPYFCTRFRERNPGARVQRENYINEEDRKIRYSVCFLR